MSNSNNIENNSNDDKSDEEMPEIPPAPPLQQVTESVDPDWRNLIKFGDCEDKPKS